MARYYSLCTCFDGQWSPEFGDFDRETVEFEREDYLDNPSYNLRKKDIVILVCKDASRAALIEAYEKRFGIPFPCKTPKEKWKAAYSEFRSKYSQIPLSERYSASCKLHVNGMDVDVWVIQNKFSVCRASEGAQLGQFSRQDFHLHLNAFMVLKDLDREVVETMRWDNKRSFRLGFRLPK